MNALVRFNLAACAYERAKIAAREENWPRNAREMKTWRRWMDYTTVTLVHANSPDGQH